MSMFGAVDLSTLAPSKGAASGAGSEGAAAPGVADSGVIDSPLVIDVDVTNFEDAVKRSMQVPVVISLWSPRSQVSAEVNTALESLAARYQAASSWPGWMLMLTPKSLSCLLPKAYPAW